jgi:transketolase
MLGDGELQEGQIWEAAMTAAHYKLDNLTIVDNRLQIDGFVSEIMNIEPVAAKWPAFAGTTGDGHDMAAILQPRTSRAGRDGPPSLWPKCKGSGVSIFENKVSRRGALPRYIALHDLSLLNKLIEFGTNKRAPD